MKRIYLDYNATTPIDPLVLEAMLPFLREHFGNPSSNHAFGRVAHEAVEAARRQTADLINARLDEIVFTGGGTEASNLAIKGVILPHLDQGGQLAKPHVITSDIEHPATLQPLIFLEKLGCRVTRVPVDRHGIVDVQFIRSAIDEHTKLISIMHSNNEVGTLQPIVEIGRIARAAGALLHTDAAQSLGKLVVDVNELGADLLTIAGHKVYAPKGVGALYVRHGLTLEPIIHGAGHERGRRAGTENVPYIVGLGRACRIAQESLPEASNRLRALRDRLWASLKERLGDRVVLNGHPTDSLPNTLNVSFLGCQGPELLAKTPTVAASTGSACHDGQAKVSAVLQAMRVPPEAGRGAVRLSLGRCTTESEVDEAAESLAKSASST